MAEKKEKNELKLPPDGGEWRFCMASSMVIPGAVLGIYDNAVLIETPAKETVILNKAQIESYWEGSGQGEQRDDTAKKDRKA